MLLCIFILLVLFLVLIKFYNLETFKVAPYDPDNILSNKYKSSKIEDENTYTNYIFNKNRKNKNLFMGSILNNYYNYLKV